MSLLINSTTLGNIIITLGSVFLLYYLIRKFAWDQITGIFVAREKKIATDIAENARQEAEILVQKRQEELAAARTEATQIIDEAKKTGKTKESKIIAEAYDEAKRLKEKANQDIAQSWVEALAGVKGEVADLTVLLAEKVMKQNLDAKAQSDLIDSYLDQLGDA